MGIAFRSSVYVLFSVVSLFFMYRFGFVQYLYDNFLTSTYTYDKTLSTETSMPDVVVMDVSEKEDNAQTASQISSGRGTPMVAGAYISALSQGDAQGDNPILREFLNANAVIRQDTYTQELIVQSLRKVSDVLLTLQKSYTNQAKLEVQSNRIYDVVQRSSSNITKQGTLTDVTLTGSTTVSGLTAGALLYPNNSSILTAANGLNIVTGNSLAIGTSSAPEKLTVQSPIYLASTSPTVTNSRLYNKDGSLYWNGTLLGGAAVGNWTANGGDVYRATGRVGIGTSTPQRALDVVGVASFRSSSDQNKYIRIGSDNTGGYLEGDPSGSPISVYVGGSERVRFTNNGNVGIGVSNPAYTLDVAGTLNASQAATLGSTLAVTGATTLSNTLSVTGTTTLSSLLDVSGVSTLSTTTISGTLRATGPINQGVLGVDRIDLGVQDGTPRMVFEDAGYTNWLVDNAVGKFRWYVPGYEQMNLISSSNNALLELRNTSGAAIQLNTSGNSYFNGGNVGIGTTAPGAKLEVLGSSRITDPQPRLQLSETDTTDQNWEVLGSGGNFFVRERDNTFASGVNRFVIEDGLGEIRLNASGNVGIGTTSPSSKLTVYGNTLLEGSNRYLNFGSTAGSTGYGIRDNAGTIEIKSSGGSWTTAGTGGTVTSVAQTVPTGWTVTGSPITTSGTLALAYDTGYAAVLTASTSNWNTFYNTPSNRITAGTGLTWSGNTLNRDTINLTSDVSGTLPVANGGTGLTSLGAGITTWWSTPTEANLESALSDVTNVFTNNDTITTANIADSYLLNTGDTASGDYNFDSNTFVIDSVNNRVGVGTSTPERALSVQGTAIVQAEFVGGASGTLIDVDTTSASAPYIGYRVLEQGTAAAFFGYNPSSSNIVISAAQGGSELLSINSLGNIGIGTTSPSALLTVGAANNFTVTSAGVVTNGTWNGTAITDAYISDTLTIGASGSVSDSALSANVSLLGQSIEESELNIAGTPTDGYLLQASSTSAGGFAWVATSTLGLGGGSGSGVSTFLDLSDTPSAYTANRLIFTNSGATALTDSANLVFDGTNLGIGTTSPTFALDVNGDINFASGKALKIAGTDVLTASTTNSSVTLGQYAGASLLSGGVANTAIGAYALNAATSSGSNTAVGYLALYSNTGGNYNSAQGYASLYSNTTGNYNSAQGYWSLSYNTTGIYNTANGTFALYSNTTGNYNSAQGASALRSNTTGSYNSAQGYAALYSNTTGSNQVAVGYNAGRYIANGATANETSGNSVYLGAGTRAFADGDTNEIVIGYNAIGIGSNTVVLGNDSIVTTALKGNVGIGTTSPSFALDVYGNTRTYQNIGEVRQILESGDDSYVKYIYRSNGIDRFSQEYATGRGLEFYNFNTASVQLALNNAGNVGVGITSPTFALDVNGDINFASGKALKIAGTDVLTASTTNSSVTLGQGAGAALLPDGLYNTAIGRSALNVATSSDGNTAVGYLALSANTTGSNNSAQGYGALRSNTTGSNNSAQGYAALLTNTTGSYNSAQGYLALRNNTTGSFNSAQGFQALFSNTTGSSNSAQGYAALLTNTTGSYNSAQGTYALYSNTTGSNQVAVGYNAGRYIADGATANATSSNSVYLGAGTRAFADGDTNEIVIGYNAIGIGSNTVVLGNDSIVTTALKGNVGIGTTTPVRKLQVYGDIRLGNSGTNGCVEDYGGGVLVGTCASDERLKTDITPLSEEEGSVLENLVALTPVTYTWNEVAHDKYAKGMNLTNTGLIAQDVEAVFPELVSENKDGFKQVNFTALPYYIIQAIKDMWQVVTGNREKIESLEDRIEALEEELNKNNSRSDTAKRRSSGNDTSSENTKDANAKDEGDSENVTADLENESAEHNTQAPENTASSTETLTENVTDTSSSTATQTNDATDDNTANSGSASSTTNTQQESSSVSSETENATANATSEAGDATQNSDSNTNDTGAENTDEASAAEQESTTEAPQSDNSNNTQLEAAPPVTPDQEVSPGTDTAE